MKIEEYIQLAKRFNKMSFINKIETLRDNKDILSLGSDYNWWIVKVNDENIQEQLEDLEETFDIENEWGSNEMYDLISIIGINQTDA